MTFLPELSREALLCERLPGGRARCLACAHRCLVPEGADGLCGVRFNRKGRLLAPWGYVSGAAPDPIEKKPFFHVLPGARTLSFGMFGCNFRCGFCALRMREKQPTEPMPWGLFTRLTGEMREAGVEELGLFLF